MSKTLLDTVYIVFLCVKLGIYIVSKCCMSNIGFTKIMTVSEGGEEREADHGEVVHVRGREIERERDVGKET